MFTIPDSAFPNSGGSPPFRNVTCPTAAFVRSNAGPPKMKLLIGIPSIRYTVSPLRPPRIRIGVIPRDFSVNARMFSLSGMTKKPCFSVSASVTVFTGKYCRSAALIRSWLPRASSSINGVASTSTRTSSTAIACGVSSKFRL